MGGTRRGFCLISDLIGILLGCKKRLMGVEIRHVPKILLGIYECVISRSKARLSSILSRIDNLILLRLDHQRDHWGAAFARTSLLPFFGHITGKWE